uniref:Semaphorin 4A n=1 Tax=Sphenodon punctatus TaxID=8508 RepID=A0A8D0GC92_SPHPU
MDLSPLLGRRPSSLLPSPELTLSGLGGYGILPMLRILILIYFLTLPGDPQRSLTQFSLEGVSNYDTFLLSGDEGTLYVGARDTILSLGVGDTGSVVQLPPSSSIKRQGKELRTVFRLGVLTASPSAQTHYTHSPSIAGHGAPEFQPSHPNPSYSSPFPGLTSEPRTCFHVSSAADAAFVASFNIPNPPDDEKVYFFFEETAKEFDFFDKLKVSRVARVCKSDVGGDKILQKKWTTFLKAQLLCSQPGHFPYSVIQHAFALPQPTGGATFYGVFTSQWQMGETGSSAVCAFSLNDIERVFNGKYKELNKESSRWTTYSGPEMDPRPGSCSVGSSSDKALTFMKDHFLMDGKVMPSNNQPLLVKQNVRYTQIAVHQTRSLSGTNYDVMFLGTDRGSLHKAVTLPSGAHIIEEIRLFENPEPVQNLLLSSQKRVLYVGYSKGVLRVPLANCSVYWSCADCILARDPYCAWDGHSQKCQDTQATEDNTSSWLQDIETGKPDPACQRNSITPRPVNSVLTLPCPQLSALANYTWRYPKRPMPEGLVAADQKTVVIIVQQETAGTYECWASENGYQQAVARYRVRSNDDPDILPGAGSDGIAEDGLQRHAVPRRSYWAQFVTVTVLLALTLAVAVALVLFSYHDKLKAKSKVQGCSTPEASKASVCESEIGGKWVSGVSHLSAPDCSPSIE